MSIILRQRGAAASRLLDTDPGDDWRDAAACRGEDTELFTSVLVGDQRRAKRICADCPSRTACLEWALHVRDDWAVLGGLTPAERRQRTQLKGQFQHQTKVTESNESSGTLRQCLRCRAPFAIPGKARYCSRQCRSQAVLAMRSGWRPREGANA